jgi:hypothetical protein
MRKNRLGKPVAKRAALDARLSGYSAGAKMAAAARRLRSRTGNWPVYAAAAGSALAMTTSASASIISGVYTGTGPHGGVSVRPQAGGATSIKGLLFSPGEINIKAVSGTTYGPFAQLSVQGIDPLRIFQGDSNSQYAKNFGFGANISSAAGIMAASGPRIVKAFFSGSDFGEFVSGQPGYLGFAVDLGSGNFNYGWLKLEFVKDPQTQMPQILEALGFGIETTPNQAIAAGATAPPVPEPGTMALAILAAGAAGVTALRRRKLAAQ